MAYWLVKTEADCYSIDHFRADKITAWTGVRNYQARNFLQDMKVGDEVLVYHSNGDPSGVAGIARVQKTAHVDETQFDKRDEHFDPKSTREKPRWFCPDLKFESKLPRIVAIDELRKNKALNGLLLLQQGSRLSVIPVAERHYNEILALVLPHGKR